MTTFDAAMLLEDAKNSKEERKHHYGVRLCRLQATTDVVILQMREDVVLS